MIKIIAAMTYDRVIGQNGKMPWRLKDEIKHFKELTTGGTVIMGRNTWESIGSRPLKNRQNIVLTRTFIMDNINSCCAVSSVGEALDKASNDSVWIIGGGEIYKEFMPLADELHISWINKQVSGSTYFPEFRHRVDIDWWYSRSSRKSNENFTYVVYDREPRGVDE